MKRLFLILAATVVLFACGNGSKKAMTVEEQAVAYYEQMMAAQGDWEKTESLMDEMEKWFDGLSKADQKKANDAVEKQMIEDGLTGEESDLDW